MGTWGSGLYDDDEACDIRDEIALSLATKPSITAEALLASLRKKFGYGTDLMLDGCPTFWMTVADQFTKHGIESQIAKTLALAAIEKGHDLKDLEARGMDARGLRARANVHRRLRQRFTDPQLATRKVALKSVPKLCVEAGEIYSFPTSRFGSSFNAYRSSWEEIDFNPTGWGALIILKAGRFKGLHPWAIYSVVVVNSNPEPTLEAILAGKTMRLGVNHCVPRQSHIKKMRMKLLGKVVLDSKRVEELMQHAKFTTTTPKRAVTDDIPFFLNAVSCDNEAAGQMPIKFLVASSEPVNKSL
jgi:hypothetical protein